MKQFYHGNVLLQFEKMISKEEKQRLKRLISDTIMVLCKRGLSDKCQENFHVDALIGIFIISFTWTLKLFFFYF